MPEKLVEVKDLEISFGEGSKKFVAVKNANFFINKGEKVFSGRVYPHADQNGILIKSGTPTGTYYELDYGRKAN